MTTRPISFVARGVWSAGSAAGLAAAILAGIGTAGFALNWIMLLAVLPPGGALSTGARILVLGILFPVAWIVAAQPIAVARGMRRFYRRHRDEVLSLVAGALQSEAGARSDQALERWLAAIQGLRDHLDQYPRAIRALLRLALRRLPADEIEAALRTGSGPLPLRVAGAVADHLEAELAGGAAAGWLALVVAANLLAYVAIALIL